MEHSEQTHKHKHPYTAPKHYFDNLQHNLILKMNTEKYGNEQATNQLRSNYYPKFISLKSVRWACAAVLLIGGFMVYNQAFQKNNSANTSQIAAIETELKNVNLQQKIDYLIANDISANDIAEHNDKAIDTKKIALLGITNTEIEQYIIENELEQL